MQTIHNEPIVCIGVVVFKQYDKVIFVDTIDRSHTVIYLENLILSSVKTTEENFKCKTPSFVTDSIANMISATKIMDEELFFGGLTYRCSAYI